MEKGGVHRLHLMDDLAPFDLYSRFLCNVSLMVSLGAGSTVPGTEISGLRGQLNKELYVSGGCPDWCLSGWFLLQNSDSGVGYDVDLALYSCTGVYGAHL